MIRKYLNKYHKLNAQLKVVFWFTFVGFFQKGISIFTTPIFTRVLTIEEYGLFNVFNSWYSVVAIVATLYLHNGVINNAFVKTNETHEKVVSYFQSLSFVVSLVMFIIGFYYRKEISSFLGLPECVIIFAFLGFVFMEPYQDWLIYKRYHFDYIHPVMITVTIALLTPIISLIAVLLGSTGKGEIRIISFVIVNTILPGAIFYIINYKKSPVFFNKKLWKYALTFNIPLIPHYLSETLLNQTDKIMINMYHGSGETGIYSVAFAAASLILVFTSAMNMAFVPWQYQKLSSKSYNELGKMAYAVLGCLAIILSVMMMFAPELVTILAGKDYSGAVYLIPTLGASVFFNYMYQLFSRIELYYEKKFYSVIATASATLLNIILNLLWLPKYGYLFAGVSTLLSHILLCLLHFTFYKKINREFMGSSKIYNGRIIVLIALAVLIFALIITVLYNFFIIRIVFFLIILLLIIIKHDKIIKILKIYYRS